jgi:hypothetical protein
MLPPIQEIRDEMILRLAQRARESGVRIIRDRRDGRFYASSASQPGLWHYITAVSCDCKGFARHARCMHHAALLVALGWVPEDDPDPSPEPNIAQLICCETCHGVGTHPATVSTGPNTWTYANVTCTDCHGRGRFACPACVDTGIVEVEGPFCGQTRTPCSCPRGQSLTVVDLTIVERTSGHPAEPEAA